MRILLAEPMAAGGLKLLRAQPGWEVIGSNPKEYMQYLADADALIVRGGGAFSADRALSDKIN